MHKVLRSSIYKAFTKVREIPISYGAEVLWYVLYIACLKTGIRILHSLLILYCTGIRIE